MGLHSFENNKKDHIPGMPGASVTDFDDWVVFAEIPDDASRGESCGEDVLNLSVPRHATDVFQGLLFGSRRHWRGWWVHCQVTNAILFLGVHFHKRRPRISDTHDKLERG